MWIAHTAYLSDFAVDAAPATKEQQLFQAVEGDFISAAVGLMQTGVCVNVVNRQTMQTPLMVASLSGNLRMVEQLLLHKAQVDLRDYAGETAFTLASQYYDLLDVMKCLVAAGANIHHSNTRGHTALSNAVTVGHEATVRWLLDIGVNPNHVDRNGRSALYSCRRANIAELLLTHKASPNIVAVDAITPLICATFYKFEEVALLLLEHEACVNYKSAYGTTPLYVAADVKSPNMTRLLLANGADPKIPKRKLDRSFETILDVAKAHGADEIVEILLQYEVAPESWIFDSRVVEYFPKVLQQQWIVLAYLWSARLDGSANALAPLPIELLHSLLSVLWRVHVFE